MCARGDAVADTVHVRLDLIALVPGAGQSIGAVDPRQASNQSAFHGELVATDLRQILRFDRCDAQGLRLGVLSTVQPCADGIERSLRLVRRLEKALLHEDGEGARKGLGVCALSPEVCDIGGRQKWILELSKDCPAECSCTQVEIL